MFRAVCLEQPNQILIHHECDASAWKDSNQVDAQSTVKPSIALVFPSPCNALSDGGIHGNLKRHEQHSTKDNVIDLPGHATERPGRDTWKRVQRALPHPTLSYKPCWTETILIQFDSLGRGDEVDVPNGHRPMYKPCLPSQIVAVCEQTPNA